MPANQVSTFRHWLPVVTLCPVNGFPDLLYVEARIECPPSKWVDLYHMRKVLKSSMWQKMSMEDVANATFYSLKATLEQPMYDHARLIDVTVRLAFSRHKVRFNETE